MSVQHHALDGRLQQAVARSAPRSRRSPAPSRTEASAARDQALLARYAATRDPALRDALVQRYLPLARHAAQHYARPREPFDDLLQIASIGLLKAIDRYDPQLGTAFASYAMPTMHGDLRRHFRDRSWAVRPPRDLQELALRVERVATELLAALGRAPTVQQLAEHTGLSIEAVLEARQALCAHTAASLSASPDEDEPHPLAGRLGQVDRGYADVEHRATLEKLMRCLTRREREIVQLRLQEDLTQHEIGQRLGLSQMHVSRVLRASLAKLREAAAG
ncbi:MAG: polymerase sigma-B factor [Baekduia sp.]|jgi:RNA polymerase sigma-B factor|nr:polymerase sigma-B factor [Baekduia sp.]